MSYLSNGATEYLFTNVLHHGASNGRCRQLPIDIEKLSKIMEEMANAPREPMGTRSPGERCMYEIQRERTRQSTMGEGVYGKI